MTSRIVLTLIASAITLSTGCAATTANFGANAPQYRLIVKVPAKTLDAVRAQTEGQFNYVLVVRSWTNGADYEKAPSYCVNDEGGLVCMANVRAPNAKFEVRALWQQPDLASIPEETRMQLAHRWETDPAYRAEESRKHQPADLCGEVRVGLTINRFGFSGGKPAAANWLTLSPSSNEKGWGCQYTVMSDVFMATRAIVAGSQFANDWLTE